MDFKDVYGEYGRVRLSRQEYNRLLNEHGEAVLLDYIERVDTHLESKNIKYNNHAATIRGWIRRDAPKNNQTGTNVPIKKNRFQNFKGREYTAEHFAEMEKLERAYQAQKYGLDSKH